jgi:hypothetical protein
MADPAQRFFEAEKLRAAGDLGRAEAAYRALLEDQPRHVGGFEGMAATCLAAGRSAEADIFTAQAAAIRADAAADVAAALLFHNDMKRAHNAVSRRFPTMTIASRRIGCSAISKPEPTIVMRRWRITGAAAKLRRNGWVPAF